MGRTLLTSPYLTGCWPATHHISSTAKCAAAVHIRRVYVSSAMMCMQAKADQALCLRTLPLSSARVLATPKVPLAKASNSKTPMGPGEQVNTCSVCYRGAGPNHGQPTLLQLHGATVKLLRQHGKLAQADCMCSLRSMQQALPFQMMVFASPRASWKAFRESGPMSRP